MRTSLSNFLKTVTFLSSFGRLFHTLAASKLNDFCPYATVLTTGIFRVFSYLKEYDDCFRVTKFLILGGAMLFIHLKVSRAIVLRRPKCSVGRFALLKSSS